jgi:multidrug efflux pump subunit AcrB
VTADVDQSKESGANAGNIMAALEADFFPMVREKYPAVAIRVEGQAEQRNESIGSLFKGFGVAFIAMFVLLTVEFRSYVQPLIILAVVPFGAIGAIWGHYWMGLPLSLFSVMGMVALTGVVINDSIVLVDFINSQIRSGVPLNDALLNSGVRRFRPVLLTSVTTVAGVVPILTETSLQAQFLIPMVASLAFGLILATALVLLLVPVFFLIYGKLFRIEERYKHERELESELDVIPADDRELVSV